MSTGLDSVPVPAVTGPQVRWLDDGRIVVRLEGGRPGTDAVHAAHERLRGRVAVGSEVVLELPDADALGLPLLAALVYLARFVRSEGALVHLVGSRFVANEVAASGLWRILPVRVPGRD